MDMNMKKLTILSMVMLMLMPVFSQADINYKHKTLVKVLKKAGIQDLNTLHEIELTNSKTPALAIMGKYFEIEIENKNHFKYIYIGRVNTCRSGGCAISNNLSQEDNSEYFDYFILFDKTFAVQLVKIFNYQASHGHEITANGWLKQFVGFNGNEELTVGKDIDSVSGATISVNTITSDILHKTELLKNIL